MNILRTLAISLCLLASTASAQYVITAPGARQQVSLVDWRPSFEALWDLDEESGTRVCDDLTICGAAGTDCDMTDVNTVGFDDVDRREGTAAGSFITGNNERLECAAGTCGADLMPEEGESLTLGCWLKDSKTSIADYYRQLQFTPQRGYNLARDGADPGNPMRCQFADGPNGITHERGTTPDGAWFHGVCLMDNPGDEVRAYVDGANAPADSAYIGDAATDSFVKQRLGSNSDGATHDGEMDECWQINDALTATEICRVCSCGLDGTKCRCLASDPTSYAHTGDNVLECGSCTLPVCNAAAPTSSAADDWSTSFEAVWSLDEVSGTRPATAGACSSGTDCDLTDNNTVTQNTTEFREGTASAQFTEVNSERLTCGSGTCEELHQESNGTSWGCWGRLDSDASGYLLRQYAFAASPTTGGGYLMDRTTTNDQLRCFVGDGLVTTNRSSASSSFPSGEWKHGVCTMDWEVPSAGNFFLYLNGSQANSATSLNISPDLPMKNFGLGASGASNEWDGQLDECFVIHDVLTAAEICRICSCGIDGTLCRCDDADATNYQRVGRNDSFCENCTLPDCNSGRPTLTAAADWSASFVAWWDFDEASGTRVATGGSCSSGSDCDLTDNNTVLNNTTDFQEGVASADFERSTSEFLDCTDATCGDEINPGGTDYTTGCWWRPEVVSTEQVVFRKVASSAGLDFRIKASDNTMDYTICDGSDCVFHSSTTAVSTVDEWYHLVGRFDDTGDTITILIDGEAESGSATQQSIANDTSSFFVGAQSAGSSGVDGEMDECFVIHDVLTDAEVCRICSCGIDGSECVCDTDPTVYHDSGRNVAECGSCVLTACNATAP